MSSGASSVPMRAHDLGRAVALADDGRSAVAAKYPMGISISPVAAQGLLPFDDVKVSGGNDRHGAKRRVFASRQREQWQSTTDPI